MTTPPVDAVTSAMSWEGSFAQCAFRDPADRQCKWLGEWWVENAGEAGVWLCSRHHPAARPYAEALGVARDELKRIRTALRILTEQAR